MRITRRRFIRRTASFGAAVALAPQAWSEDRKSFVVGASLSMTGPFAQFGQLTDHALRAGIKQVNDKGGILGRKVEFMSRDDAGNPGRALLAAKELVEEQKVDFLYPETLSGLVVSVLPYLTEQKVFTATVGATPEIGDGSKFPYSFQLSDLATKRVPAVATALKELGGTKAGILVSTNPATVALGDGLQKVLPEKYGIQAVANLKFAGDAKDFAPLLQSIRDAGADIVAFDGVSRDSVRIVMSGVQSIGWRAKIVGEPAVVNGDLLEQIAPEVQDQFYSVNYRVATRSGAGVSDRMADFIKELRSFGPIQSLGLSASIRDVVFLVKWANETAQQQKGSTDAEAVKQVLENIASADYPADYALMLGNPRYAGNRHNTGEADYSTFWGLIHPSPLVDGTYEGVPLNVVE